MCSTSSSLSTAVRCLTWAAIAFGVSLLAVLMTIQRCISTDICPHRHLAANDEDEPAKCRFTFTKVREHNLECAFGCCKCIALAEISVYGSSTGSTSLTKLNVSSVSNPGGRSPPGEGPGSAVDGQVSTKLVDKSFATGFAPGPEGYSVLELELERVPHELSVSAYSLVTADDAPWRDPVEWGVRCWTSQGLELADAQSLLGSAAPSARLASLGVFPLAPLSPPSPPADPLLPPAAPPPPALSGDLRLIGGASPSEGLLQVYHGGEWGTVCDDRFSMVDATVACRQMGWYGRDAHPALVPLLRPHVGWAALAVDGSNPGGGGGDAGSVLHPRTVGRVWMDQLACKGTEARLDQCAFSGWGVENCAHTEDVALRCNVTREEPPDALLAPAVSRSGQTLRPVATGGTATATAPTPTPTPTPTTATGTGGSTPPCVGLGSPSERARSIGCLRSAFAALALPALALLGSALWAAAAARAGAAVRVSATEAYNGEEPKRASPSFEGGGVGLGPARAGRSWRPPRPTYEVQALGGVELEMGEGVHMLRAGAERSDSLH